MLPLLLCFAAIAQSVSAQGSGVCNSAAFQAVPASPLGASPLTIRTLVQGNTVCLEFGLASSAPANTAWFAVGLARNKAMVNSPNSNVMLFQSDVGTPESYVLSAYSPSGVFKEPTQTSFTVISTSTSPLKYSYERQLTAQSQYDVPIDVTQEMNFVWSFGKSWPISGHSPGSMGTASYSFAAGANRGGSNAGTSTFTTPSTGYCDGKNCSAILGAIAFGVMLLFGFIFTLLAANSKFTKTVLEKTLAAPPVKSTTNAPIPGFGTRVAQAFADLRVGELIVILIFLVAAIMIRVLSKVDSYRITSGKIALMVLMFLILPISKVPLWSVLFGSSFERIVKFHRWLGTLLLLAVIVHLVLVLQKVNATSTTQYNNAVPLWGFLAFITLVLTVLSANDYMRRLLFEVFFFSHRILGILVFVFTILHSPARVGTALAVPLAFYFVGLLDQWRRSYLSSYQASVQANDVTGTTTILLQPSKKLVHYVESMNLCSYFWVRIPAVSSYEWHPFTAIVTRDGDTLGFCIRGMGNDNTFTRRLHAYAKTTQSINLNLCGPFGKIGMDVTQYDTVLWIGGGVGFTPLLSAVNHRHRLASLKSHVADWHVLWSVRRPHELLMGETFMPMETSEMPSANQNDTKSSISVTWHCYCSDETADGSIERSQGDAIRYRGGLSVLDEYINTSRWVGKNVAVFACGPPTMTVAAQALARQCGFAFHKEVFSW